MQKCQLVLMAPIVLEQQLQPKCNGLVLSVVMPGC